MLNNLLFNLPNITSEELTFLKDIADELTEEQQNTFVRVYSQKRRNPQHLLLFALLGFFGFAGIQRFVTNQIGMGLVYILTAGLCFIGTLVDIINYKSLANQYNKTMAAESFSLVKL